ncbi:MAG TPA: TIM barrel protein [Candidatus Acidoferrum sp.]|jgi:hydroxypyruvate isomerase
MRRRQFMGICATTVVGAGVGSRSIFAGLDDINASETADPFPFSVMLWTVEPKLPFDERIAKVAEAGYRAVELVDEYDHWSKEEFAHAKTRLRSLGIVVDACSGIRSSICDPSQREAFLAEIRAKLPIMDQLQCFRLILLSGDTVPGLSREQMHASCVEGLQRAAEIAGPQNVELLLENIDPEENSKYFLTSVAEGFEVIRKVGNRKVKFLYDFFHEQISEGNLISKLEKNIDLVGLVHVADVPGRHEPGTGEINYANIFRKLGQLHYSGYVAMEFIPTGNVVTSLRAAREFARKYGEEGVVRGQNAGLKEKHAPA